MTENNDMPAIKPTTSELTFSNIWDHILARWGVKRMEHRVESGVGCAAAMISAALRGQQEASCSCG